MDHVGGTLSTCASSQRISACPEREGIVCPMTSLEDGEYGSREKGRERRVVSETEGEGVVSPELGRQETGRQRSIRNLRS